MKRSERRSNQTRHHWNSRRLFYLVADMLRKRTPDFSDRRKTSFFSGNVYLHDKIFDNTKSETDPFGVGNRLIVKVKGSFPVMPLEHFM